MNIFPGDQYFTLQQEWDEAKDLCTPSPNDTSNGSLSGVRGDIECNRVHERVTKGKTVCGFITVYI